MPAEATNPTLGWNIARDVGEVLEYHFMINALLAGTIVAVIGGLLGWLMIVRRQSFAGHTLSVMAFPGAAAAALLGMPAALGYFGFCCAGGLAIDRFAGGGQRSWQHEGASVGAVQASALAAGFLFVSLYGGVLGDLESLLFGNVLGISDGRVLLLAATAAGVLVLLAVSARPLLFASVDPEVAHARGVPVRGLSRGFLLMLGVVVAATSLITGPLLVFALLVMPAATAQELTARPALSLALTVALGLLVVWLGMGLAYFSVYPAGVFITGVAFALYLPARLLARARARRARGRPPLPSPPAAEVPA